MLLCLAAATIEEVVAMAKNAHQGKGGLSPATEVDIRTRGPFSRWSIGGSEVGNLHFQPSSEITQHPIRTHFAKWLSERTNEERAQHDRLMEVLLSGRPFDYAPIYRRDRFVIDGAHRALAAYEVSLSHDPSISMEILAEAFEP
jgi:hypothetical protein